MISLKNYLKKYWILVLAIIFYIGTFSLLFTIFTSNDFIIGNDSLTQYSIFYEEWIKIIDNLLKNHTFNTYSYNMFLGTDFYSAMGYYCTGDIFLPILYLFKSNLYVGLIVETILCILISGITMSIFLEDSGIKNKNIIIFVSLLYAIAGHSINYVQVYMFHRFYAFLPLLFYGTQRYFKDGKKTTFIISITILFMQNFYFMYPTLIVLFIYCFIECLKRNYLLKDIAKHFLILLLSIVIGFLISSIVALPAIIYTYKNVVTRTAFDSSLMWNIRTFFGLYFSYLMSNVAGALPNIFGTNNYYEDNQNMFMTIISLIFLVYFLIRKNKKYHHEKIMLCILTIIIIVKPFNSIMHGFAEPSLRWIFLYSFYSLYLVALGIDEYTCSDKYLIKKIGTCIVIFSFICFIALFFIINNSIELSALKEHLVYMFVCLLASFFLFILMLRSIKASVIVSLVYILFVNLFFAVKVSTQCSTTAVIDSGEIDYYQDYDTKYYRYYLSYLDSYYGIVHDCNNSLKYNIMTTSTYSSTIETAIRPFLNSANNKLFLDWGVEISDPNLLTMLGTKYFILGDRYKKEKGNINYEKAYSLEALKNFDVFYNPNYKGFGYTANKVKYFKDYNGNTKDYVDYIMVDDQNIDISKYHNIQSVPLNVTYMGENIIISDIYLSEDNLLLIPIPNNSGWKITVNDQLIKPISVNGGFVGLEISKGENNIKMSFSTPYLKEGFILSTLGIVFLIINIVFEKGNINKRV